MTDWIEEIEWNDILDEIRNEQCVLVVGPDLVGYENDRTLFGLLRDALQRDAKMQKIVDTQLVFEHEELLQMLPNGRLTPVFGFLRKFYAERTEFDEPFAKIAQLPFHLIISLLPDQRLPAVFDRQNQEYRFGYYPGTDTPKEVEKPSRAKPLVYNILGVLDPPDTVVTFDHLFAYLQGILGTRPLPLLLDETLRRAKSFLFLGVHFEKWYMQVLLRVFVPRNGSSEKLLKYSMLRAEHSNDTCTFIARRLELDFLSIEPLDFLNELHRRCTEAGLLRTAPKSSKKRIFISYSHQDKLVVETIVERLKNDQIEPVMDDTSMPAGEKIRHFMQRVNEMDKVIVVVSTHSLQSPWVGKEMLLSLEKGIDLIPCHLDRRFLDKDLVGENKAFVNQKLREINRFIAKRKDKDPLDDAPDLVQEETLWREFGQKLPELAAHLQGSKSIALEGDGFESGINVLINNIIG